MTDIQLKRGIPGVSTSKEPKHPVRVVPKDCAEFRIIAEQALRDAERRAVKLGKASL